MYHASNSELGTDFAVKVFKTSILVFKDRDKYVTGEFRFRKGYNKHNPRKMVKLWASPYRQLPPIASRPNPIKTEPVDDGRPAPAALPSDCCGRPSPTHSVAGRPSEPAEP